MQTHVLRTHHVTITRRRGTILERMRAEGEAIRVAVVDDHPIARYGLERLLAQAPNILVVATASAPDEVMPAPDAGSAPGIDVIVMDLYLDGDQPSLASLCELATAAPVLVMSASVRPSDVVGAVQAGASGYLSKQAGFDTFRAAVEIVASGGFWLSSQLADILRSQLAAHGGDRATHSTGGLSPREEEVLDCIARGFTHVQTARRMGISKATVDTYVERIRGKMHVGNKAELTRLALERRRDESPR